MKIVTTLTERDEIPNPLRYQRNSNGSWTVYEQGDTLPVLPAPPAMYEDVSARQLRLAMLQLGLLASVDAAVALASQAVKIEWQFAASFNRYHPTVLAIQAAMGKSDADLNALWALALSL